MTRKTNNWSYVISGKHTLQAAKILRSLRFLFNLTPVGWKTLCVGPSMLQASRSSHLPVCGRFNPFNPRQLTQRERIAVAAILAGIKCHQKDRCKNLQIVLIFEEVVL